MWNVLLWSPMVINTHIWKIVFSCSFRPCLHLSHPFFKSQVIFIKHLTFCPPEVVTRSGHHHHPLFNVFGSQRLMKPMLATNPIFPSLHLPSARDAGLRHHVVVVFLISKLLNDGTRCSCVYHLKSEGAAKFDFLSFSNSNMSSSECSVFQSMNMPLVTPFQWVFSRDRSHTHSGLCFSCRAITITSKVSGFLWKDCIFT